jgi:uncharacterized membrane protein YebE (DUF533 family)
MSDSSPQKWFKLEESFFKEVDHQLLQKLQAQLATEERATAIQRLTGLTDADVCRHIAAMNISVESLAALRLVPLVAVAWADDRIEDNERFKIIQCAEKAGLTPGDASYELLQSWLSKRPPQDLLDTWVEYARNLSQSLDGEARKNFQRTLVQQVQAIAEANGGLFGLGSISPAEHKVVELVRQTLA